MEPDATPDPALTAAAPTTERALTAWLRLARSSRVGATTFQRLIREFGSAEAGLDALPQIAAQAGVKTYAACTAETAAAELSRGRAAGARPIPLGAADYPPLLARLSDAPPLLWARGPLLPQPQRSIALVGARNASALGQRMAGHLARELGPRGFVIVSGLARGIDTAAHAAALPTGTVAVLAGGVDVIYPRENVDLAAQIAETGLILSEMPPGLEPQARHFPRRNRIISGLCPGLVVVEGAAKSGSLITARTALDQGREVMAVPGHPFDARAAGCNMLIRDGATLVRNAEDIAQALALPERPRPVPAPELPLPKPNPGVLPKRILNLLGPAPISEDALIRDLSHPPAQVLAALSELDLSGQIQRHPGGLVSSAVA
ncbi:MAG: DNA-processing protein DprA [Pseudomonadota bacterium]